MLLQIRDFIQKNQVVNLQQLTREFHIEEQALQPMLQIWIDKGVVRPCQDKAACQSSCFRCSTKAIVYYEFITHS